MDEAHISTQQYLAQAHARVSQAHVDEKRPQSDQCASRASTQETFRVKTGSQFAFTPQIRLTKKHEIERVFRFATFRKAVGAVVITGIENELAFARMGLAISRRSVPSAVVRNRVKRVIREWFRINKHEFAGIDFMVSLRRRVDEPQRIRVWLATATREIRSSR